MGRGISKKRAEMGEEAWKEYQKARNHRKGQRYLKKNPRSKERNKSYATYWRIRKKKELIDYKGGKCEKCGYNKDVLGAYDFHHIDPNEKEFSISKWTKLNSKRLKDEVDKCILVCKNCHAEIHDEQRKDIREEAFRIHNKRAK